MFKTDEILSDIKHAFLLEEYTGTHFEKRVLNQWALGGVVYVIHDKEQSFGDHIAIKSLTFDHLLEINERITVSDMIIHEFPVNSSNTRMIRSLGSVVAHTDPKAVELGAADLQLKDLNLLADLSSKCNVVVSPAKGKQNIIKPVSGDLPALFLDRDGVLIEHVNYPDKVEDVRIIKEILPLLKTYQKRGWLLIVITNQSGIGRGFFGEKELYKVNQTMEEAFESYGINIDMIYHSPYYFKTEQLKYFQFPQKRKPGPGLFYEARDQFGIDLSRSIMIGNRFTDLMAGYWAGITSLKLFNPLGKDELIKLKQAERELGLVFENVDGINM